MQATSPWLHHRLQPAPLPRHVARTICPMLQPDASHVPASQLLACSVLHRLATHIISPSHLAAYKAARLHAHARAAAVHCTQLIACTHTHTPPSFLRSHARPERFAYSNGGNVI